MSDAGGFITRFDFPSGLLDLAALRGSHLALHGHYLVHRGTARLETLPLATIASVRVIFERDTRRLAWGSALVIIALLVLAASAPIAQLAGGAAQEMAAAGGHGVARALHGFFRVVEAIANALPLAALAGAVGGAALAVLGWMGSTTLSLVFAGSERSYTARGRNTRLLDFAEAVSERLILLKR